MLGRRRIRVHLEALWSSAAVRLPPLPRLTEEGRQMGHRLEEGPRLDLLVRGERLQQVLRQQRHFGVEARGDAPAGTAGIYAAPPAAAVSAGAVTAARRRLWGRQRHHFRSHRARVAERSAPPAGGAPKLPAAPPPRPASAHPRPIRARRRARPPNPRPSPQTSALLLVRGRDQPARARKRADSWVQVRPGEPRPGDTSPGVFPAARGVVSPTRAGCPGLVTRLMEACSCPGHNSQPTHQPRLQPNPASALQDAVSPKTAYSPTAPSDLLVTHWFHSSL